MAALGKFVEKQQATEAPKNWAITWKARIALAFGHLPTYDAQTYPQNSWISLCYRHGAELNSGGDSIDPRRFSDSP